MFDTSARNKGFARKVNNPAFDAGMVFYGRGTHMIYFDHAATSFPKPRGVIEEMEDCMRYYCGNPGRSGHKLSMVMGEKIYEFAVPDANRRIYEDICKLTSR